LAAVATVASLSGCKPQESGQEQNITVDNGIDPNAEIEAVPAGEGSGEPMDDGTGANTN